MHGLERCGLESSSGGDELDRLRGRVAERLADGGSQLWDNEQNLVLITSGDRCLGDKVAAYCIQCCCRKAVCVTALAKLARNDCADALADGDKPCRLLVKLVGGVWKFLS